MDTTAQPLLITDDDELLDDLLRIAAAAGVAVRHTRSPDSRLSWRAASVVLLDARLVRLAVMAQLPRRTGVIVVASTEPDTGVWEHCVLLGVERTVVVGTAEDLLVGVLAESVVTGPGGGRVVGVIGARGGAGASVLAAAIAVAGLRSGSGVLLADCDPWGAGQDLLLGLEADPGLRWADLSAPSGRVGLDTLHDTLPSMAGRPLRGRSRPGSDPTRSPPGPGVLSVLSHDRRAGVAEPSPDALGVVLDACRRSGELAVLDLPRAPGPLADRAAECADLVIVVAPAEVPACFAARRIIDRLTTAGTRLGLVVRGPSPGGLDGADISVALEVPLVAQMRPQPRLARDLELGRAPGMAERSPLGRAARAVLTAVGSGTPSAAETVDGR